jgi:hypothetical protein
MYGLYGDGYFQGVDDVPGAFQVEYLSIGPVYGQYRPFSEYGLVEFGVGGGYGEQGECE